uniref:Uncharacterized protein n=1 Tax=Gorilla gorilla gorilla TaxID=9595 RepID=A0A2I2YI40_GORGO
MHTTESKNEHLEDENFQTSTTPQSLIDPNNTAHEETKTVLSDTEEIKPQTKKETYISCPLRGVLNVIITNDTYIIIVLYLFLVFYYFHKIIFASKVINTFRTPCMQNSLNWMLLAGFMIRNVPFINEHVHVPNTWSSILRSIALNIILIRAGLGLDPQVDLQLQIDSVLGAVSLAVVVLYTMLLQENGYGVEEDIPTLLMAASSMDDILAITGFNTCLSIVFSSGGILNNAIASIRNVCISLLAGIVLGFFVRYFPSEDQKKLTLKRGFLVLTMCVSAVLGSQRIGLHGSGGLCTLVLSFIAGTKWSQEKMKVQKIITTVWDIFQPLLFGLVGAEVSVSSLESNISSIFFLSRFSPTLSLSIYTQIFNVYFIHYFRIFLLYFKINQAILLLFLLREEWTNCKVAKKCEYTKERQ